MAALSKDELEQQIQQLACRLEPTEPERGWLTEWLQKYTQALSEWNLIEFASEKLRWQIGDLMIQLENRYGESAHTVIEMLHDLLNKELDVRITLNALYRCARLARMFPKQYRYRNVPYSVYQIIGEMDVGTTDSTERVNRRRLLVEGYSNLRREQAVPVDYHAIRQFCDEYLQALLPAGAYQQRASKTLPEAKVVVLEDDLDLSVPPKNVQVVEAEIVSVKSASLRECESSLDTTEAHEIGVFVSLETTGVQLRLELRCASNRSGLIELVERFVHELRQHGYSEVFYDTWEYAGRPCSVPSLESGERDITG